MGNILVDLDQTFGRFQQSYLFALTQHDFRTAATILFQLNASLPNDARISDLKSPELPDTSASTMINSEKFYQTYCETLGPVIMSALSDYRTKMLSLLDNQ